MRLHSSSARDSIQAYISMSFPSFLLLSGSLSKQWSRGNFNIGGNVTVV